MAKKRRSTSKARKKSSKSDDKSTSREIAGYIVIIIIGIIMAQHMNVVVSGSMEPAFYRGDVVLIQKANFLGIQEMDASNLKPGDIVIYKATWFPEPVIHRIISTGKGADGSLYYITKGDNNPRPDPAPVYPDQVEAKVINLGNNPFIIPRIGYITLWIRGI
jgi:signal peptidase